MATIYDNSGPAGGEAPMMARQAGSDGRDVELSGCLAITRFGFDHGYLAAASSRISSSPALVRRPIASDTPHPDDGPPGQLGFLKNFTPEKKQTKDGQPAKRRGPKPDSKPALTRRQELNRQAQRTHRERKEMYIKALEQEVLRLKELFAETAKERDAIAQENRRLKELLATHGISYDFASQPIQFHQDGTNYGPSSSGSISGSYRPASDSTVSPPVPSGQNGQNPSASHQHGQPASMAQLPSNRLDYDQIGIDFVLTLERPCMEHMQYLMVRSHNPDNQPFHHPLENSDDAEHEHMSGHALMATAPPGSHVMEKPAEKYPHQVPAELGTPDLAKLLDLSNRLPIDREGEITPIMAWTLVLKEPRVAELTAVDLQALKAALSGKVTCYGFGAVIEEFEVRDAILAMFQQKDGRPRSNPIFAPEQIPVYG